MSTESEVLRFELLDLILENGGESAELTDHSLCLALSSCLRGKLCALLASQPPRHLRAGERLYLGTSCAQPVPAADRAGQDQRGLSRGEELTLRIYKSGEILGEFCLCGGGCREEAVALEAIRVTEMPLVA